MCAVTELRKCIFIITYNSLQVCQMSQSVTLVLVCGAFVTYIFDTQIVNKTVISVVIFYASSWKKYRGVVQNLYGPEVAKTSRIMQREV